MRIIYENRRLVKSIFCFCLKNLKIRPFLRFFATDESAFAEIISSFLQKRLDYL